VAGLLPAEQLGDIPATRIAAALLILLVCFVAGAITKTRIVPLAPTPNIGSVRVVRRDCLQRIDAPMGAVVNSLMQWGIGSQELFQRTRPLGEPEAGE
jgi:hypothetical protein